MPITIHTMTEKDKAEVKAIAERCSELVAKGICPTCQNFKTGDVYPKTPDRVFYEDEKLICLLESYPRGLGHTILLSRKHYEDISEMPVELGCHFVLISRAVVIVLKDLFGAVKVYQVTMCSGEINHLHFQLVPRLEGDKTGGQVFSMPRGVLTGYKNAVQVLRRRVRELL